MDVYLIDYTNSLSGGNQMQGILYLLDLTTKCSVGRVHVVSESMTQGSNKIVSDGIFHWNVNGVSSLYFT